MPNSEEKEDHLSRSIEELHHFCCSVCGKWWTVGDAQPEKTEWFCPWCGRKGIFTIEGTN